MSRTRKRLARHLGPIGIVAAAAAGALGFTGCSGEDDSVGTCVSTEQYFAERVWAPILSQKCIACHNPVGLAGQTKFVLKNSAEAGFLDANLAIVKEASSLEVNGKSVLLLKPTNSMTHGGGLQISKGGAEYAALEGLLARFKHPVECQTDTNAYFADVVMLDWARTLRKASLALAGRLPTPEEEKQVTEGGEKAFDKVVGNLMDEPVFYERLKQIYNDQFLTDRYLGGTEALDVLPDSDDEDTGAKNYYNAMWFKNVAGDGTELSKYGATDSADLENKLAEGTSFGVAREPLELIAHVVKNNRPFTEILTANYLMVNPFSAKALGTTDAKFTNEADPFEFQEGHIGGEAYAFPTAGVLSSPVWLIRHPTTPTNVNRHRARMIYQYFMGTDILKTAQRPLDPTKITDFNPTMNNPNCAVCHQQVDPVAGAYHIFDEFGRYMAEDAWLPDMRPPGFGAAKIPFEEFPNSLQWLGKAVTADPRFALAAVYIMYQGFTGQDPLTPPVDVKADTFSGEFKGYLAQYHAFNQFAANFKASNFNLKVVVRDIIKSPYFRAVNAVVDSAERQVELSQLGTGNFVIPEQLSRKIAAVTGFPWKTGDGNGDTFKGAAGADFLLDRNEWYHILYGGIDSNDVTARAKDPNGVMANIIDRMANEMACTAVPRDFVLPQGERKLFPMVETTFEPKDANGFDVVPAVEAVKKNIQYLHKRILGEQLELNDPEVERTYQLFIQLFMDGKQGMAKPEGEAYSKELPYPCQVHEDFWTGAALPEDQQLTMDENYAVRAWMGVVAYLLSDYNFVFE